METWLKQSLFAAGVSVAITAGLVYYEKKQAAAQAASGAPTTTAKQTLSLSGESTATLTLPAGGTLTSSSSANTSIATVNGLQVTAVAQGSTTVTVLWTDSNGNAQTTNVPIVVTA